jgi:hypothetical protein
LYKGINDAKKGYQSRTRIVKDEKGDLFADSHSIIVRWGNPFSQILNVHGVSDVRQAEIHTAEQLVPEPSILELELAIEKLVTINKIPAELIKARERKFAMRFKNLSLPSGIRRNCLNCGRSRL